MTNPEVDPAGADFQDYVTSMAWGVWARGGALSPRDRSLLVLAMTLVAMLGPSRENVIIALAIVITPNNSRVIRGATLSFNVTVTSNSASASICRSNHPRASGRKMSAHEIPVRTYVTPSRRSHFTASSSR